MHNHVWDAIPKNLISGMGCYYCGLDRQVAKRTMSHETFVKKMRDISPNIQILGKYTTHNNQILCRCNKHDYEWNGRPGDLLRGKGCYICGRESLAKTQSKSHEDFVKDIKQTNPNIEIVSTYISRKNDVDCKCNICGYQWRTRASYLYKNNLCPLCSNQVVVEGKNDLATTHPHLVQYVRDTKDCYTHCATNIEKIYFKCPICGDERKYSLREVVIYGYHCHYCDKNISKPNRIIRNLIRQLPVDTYTTEYQPDWIKPYHYDVYFEYQGTPYIVEMDGGFHFQWFKSLGMTENDLVVAQERDRIKDEKAKEHNITMIRINCVPTTLPFITSQLQNSLISQLFDLSGIDWDSLLYTDKTLMQEICDAYNKYSKISATKLAKFLNMDRHTVAKYLKIGTKIGICNYKPNSTRQVQLA